MEEVACHDHTDADCIFVAVLSHGEMGILYAQDQPFKPDRLWCHFNAEKCPTLAGKPKLFFIQACQGDQVIMILCNGLIIDFEEQSQQKLFFDTDKMVCPLTDLLDTKNEVD